MSGKKESIGLDAAQRRSLLRLSSLYKESLGDDFSAAGLMLNYCWANYLQKLLVADEREVGIKRAGMTRDRAGISRTDREATGPLDEG